MRNRTTDKDHWLDEGLVVVQHLMACGQLLATQLPSASTWTPEKRLAAAVLSSTLVEVRDHGTDHRRRRQIAKALAWIATDDSAWPYSFVRLCQVFGLRPEWVREVVRGWQQVPRKECRRHGLACERAS